MKRKWPVLVLVISGSAAVLIAVQFAHESLAVDTCLDRGGSFDYVNTICDYDVSHPFIAYSARHPDGSLVFWSSLAISFVALIPRRLVGQQKPE